MKKLVYSVAAASVLLIGALAFVAVTSNDSAEAQAADTPQATIDGLVDAGIIGDTLADFLNELVQTVEDSGIEIPESEMNDELDPQELKKELEEFDFAQLEEWLTGISDFSFEDFDVNSFGEGFGDGFAFDFNLEDLEQRFENFDFSELEGMLEGFDFEQFGEGFAFDFETLPKFGGPEGFGPGLLFGGDFLGDLNPEDLKDAFENGTLDELIDWDTVIADILADAKTGLDAAVDNGKLTQAEADEKLQHLEDRLNAMANGEFNLFDGGWFEHKNGANA